MYLSWNKKKYVQLLISIIIFKKGDFKKNLLLMK